LIGFVRSRTFSSLHSPCRLLRGSDRCLLRPGGMSASRRSPRGDGRGGASGVAPDPQSHHGELPHRALAADPPDPPIGDSGARLRTAFRLVTTRKPSANSTRQEFNRRLRTRMRQGSPSRWGNRARQNQVKSYDASDVTAISCGPEACPGQPAGISVPFLRIARHHVNQSQPHTRRPRPDLRPSCMEALWV
jgi:hypothetical protein